MKNISIRDKLILYSVLLGIAAIAVTSITSYNNARQGIIERSFDQLISLRVVKKNQLENFFRDRIRDIELLSKSEEIKKAFTEFSVENKKNTTKTSKPEIISDNYLTNYFKACGYYNRLIFFDENGISSFKYLQNTVVIKENMTEEYTVNLFGNIKSILKNKNFPEIIDYIPDNHGNYFLYLVIPVDYETCRGFVVLEIVSDVINKLMFENNPAYGFGLTGDFYLVGKDYLMRSNSRFLPQSVMKTRANTRSVELAFENKEGSEIISDYRGIACLSSFSKVKVPGLNWVIIAEFDLSEAMIPIVVIKKNIVFMGVFIAIVLFILAYIFAGMLTLPVKRLKRASEQVSTGNFDINLEVNSNDELGILTNTFNNMANELKKRSDELRNEQLRSMRAMIDGQDFERQRLSRELHDGLGQELIATKLKLESIDIENTDKTGKILSEVKQLFGKIIDEVRRMSNNLMPALLDEFGIIKALNNLCNDIAEMTSIKIDFKYSELPKKLENRIKIYIYRIIQEGISNIIRHSGANEANIKLYYENNKILLNISDNGKGFDISKIPFEDCKGIYNMKERARLLDGKIDIVSESGRGTEILIVIPLN